MHRIALVAVVFAFVLSSLTLFAGTDTAEKSNLLKRDKSELSPEDLKKRLEIEKAATLGKPTSADNARNGAKDQIHVGAKASLDLSGVDSRLQVPEVYPTDPRLAEGIKSFLKKVSFEDKETKEAKISVLEEAQLKVKSDIRSGLVQEKVGRFMMYAVADLVAQASPKQLEDINVENLKMHFDDYLKSGKAEKHFIEILDATAADEAIHPNDTLREATKDAIFNLERSNGAVEDEETVEETVDCTVG